MPHTATSTAALRRRMAIDSGASDSRFKGDYAAGGVGPIHEEHDDHPGRRGACHEGRVIRLVINADDLGLHRELDAGILRAHREGIVTSATVLATGPSAAEAVERARGQGLPLGLHFSLSTRLLPAATDVP